MDNKTELNQQLSQNQSLVMNQAMQQAFTVLSLPLLELEEWIQKEFESNPLVECKTTRHASSCVDVSNTEPFIEPNIDELELACSFSKLDQPLAYYLFYNTDSAGVLAEPLRVIAQKFNTTKKHVSFILSKLMEKMPKGTIATSLRESLLLKLLKDSKQKDLIENHYEDLIAQKYSHIVRSMKISFEEIKKLLESVLHKDSKHTPFPQIVPDLIYKEGECTLVKEHYPELILKKEYLKLSNDPFVRKHLASAKWVIRILDKRTRLLSLLALSIEQQSFDKSPKELATELGCHESTLSRILAHKYIQTEDEILPLSHFFATRKRKKLSIDAQIKKLVQDEIIPFTDEELASQVVPKLSRRTIAKHRKRLGIPTSTMRKKGPS